MRFWALGASLAVHLTALVVLGAFHFSRAVETTAANPADISVHAIERALEHPEPIPKPKVEPSPAPIVVSQELPVFREIPKKPEKKPHEMVTPSAVPQHPAPTSLFFGAETVASRVCYVVDGSGSMFGLMYLVRQQLRESILNLSPDQSFNIIFYMQDGQLLKAFDSGLEPALPAVKTEALNLIGRIRPEGQTRAEEAIEAALRLRDRSNRQPEVVFFLTDGFDLMDGGRDDLIRRIRNLRKKLAPQAIVHTIGIYPARQDSEILSQLAKTCDGRYIEVKGN